MRAIHALMPRPADPYTDRQLPKPVLSDVGMARDNTSVKVIFIRMAESLFSQSSSLAVGVIFG